MKSFVMLPYKKRRVVPKQFQGNDNRYPEELVEYFLSQFTIKGDSVLDIFAGLGTTLLVAEEMHRVPFGIEFDVERFNYIQSQLKCKDCIVHGDARKLDEYDFPEIDFAITSPPFMNKDDAQFALTAYTTIGTYQAYLDDLTEIFRRMKTILKPNAHVVIEAANLKRDFITTLAWDIARRISKVLTFKGEIVIGWKGETANDGVYGHGYDHSYCLVFRNE